MYLPIRECFSTLRKKYMKPLQDIPPRNEAHRLRKLAKEAIKSIRATNRTQAMKCYQGVINPKLVTAASSGYTQLTLAGLTDGLPDDYGVFLSLVEILKEKGFTVTYTYPEDVLVRNMFGTIMEISW